MFFHAGSPTPQARIELLERRRMMSATYPTADEQYLVELINRARAAPAQEAANDGIDLNEGLPANTISIAAKQPLAINPYLVNSAEGHSQYMISSQTFSHEGPGSEEPNDRMAASGYTFTAPYGWGENIANEGFTTTPNPDTVTLQEDTSLFVDSTEPGRGHRVNMEDPSFAEVGTGVISGVYQGYQSVVVTEDFAFTSGESFLTGVAYTDADKAHFYAPGEGMGGVTIEAINASSGATFSTTTWAAGGYSLQLPNGTYSVLAYGGGLPGAVVQKGVVINGANVEVDATPLLATGAVAVLGADGTLTVTGTENADVISLSLSDGTLDVLENGVTQTFTYSQIKAIDVSGLAGADAITIGPGIMGCQVGGGIGRDSITGGTGDDTILGGRGADTLRAGSGNDLIYGGKGNDMLFGGAGNDTLYGNLGDNTLTGGAGNNVLYANNGQYDSLNGSAGNDVGLWDQGLDDVVDVTLL